jgi:ABC-type transporter Mla maintaining outer membrane lipid asymmetry ATPase subunit MlaF
MPRAIVMPPGDALVELRGVSKDYHALRPLRIHQLDLRQGRSLAVLGLDLAMAEVLVNLITGANLPDTGEVRVFGRATRDVTSADEWVSTLDGFGLISERAVLVEQFTAEQNLAMPLSLEVDDMSPALRRQVRAIAEEVSFPADTLGELTGSLSAAWKLRLRLGRALALGPRVLLAEHPNASLDAEAAAAFAADFARIIRSRQLASLVLTADRAFAGAVADEVLTLEPATGALKAVTGWRRWFGGGNGT